MQGMPHQTIFKTKGGGGMISAGGGFFKPKTPGEGLADHYNAPNNALAP